MAGHSKFANIKHRKGAQDAKRAKLFLSILSKISIEAKSNNNPDTNSKLKMLIYKAKKYNIPKEKISNALKNNDNSQSLKSFLFECFFQNNINFLIFCNAMNYDLIFAELKKVLNKYNAHIGLKNSVVSKYNKVEQIIISKHSISENDIENIVCSLPIEDYTSDQNNYYLFFSESEIHDIISYFDKNNILYDDVETTYRPYEIIEVEDSELKYKLTNFLSQIENLNFVTDIFYNFKIT